MNRVARRMFTSLALTALAATPASAVVISPGPDIQERLQEALILAKPGDVIELDEGVFELTMGVSLDVDDVTIRGRGMNKSILSFKNQNAGAEGLLVTGTGVTLADFAVEDAIGDGIKAKGADGITFLNVRAEWTGGPKSTNGAYGFYPVESKNVLIDGCVASGASDAGIYVGQCQHIVVRNSTAKYNVAGIEIENCYYADVYNNVATHNAGGILVFDLPDLPQQGGHDIRVFNNKSIDNDTKNFAPEGNIVGYVPTGSGMMIMANTNVEVFGNEFSGNGTVNFAIRGYMPYGGKRPNNDPNYYPYPRNLHIHNNTFGRGGYKPMGERGELYAEAAGGAPIPDIMWDGIKDDKAIAKGELPPHSNIFIHDNGDADFIDLDLPAYMKDPKSAKPSRDIDAHKGSLPPIDPVNLPQDS